MSNYTPEGVLRILPSVFDRVGFYDRGGRHPPEDISDTADTSRSYSDPRSSMTPLCEVLDVTRAMEKITPQERMLVSDYVTRPLSTVASIYGRDWHILLFGACCEIADLA